MKILQIHIKNLNSLQLEATIDFQAPPLSQTGLFAITGDTGAGKTTILDAITLALYGYIPRKSDPRDAMSYGSAESRAEVVFQTQSGTYKSYWSLRRAYGKPEGRLGVPKMELAQWSKTTNSWETIAEKIKDTREGVEKVSGLDYQRFCRSVLLSQGDFAAFLKADEKERSDLLERITGTEIYTRLSQAAFKRHKQEQEALEKLTYQKEAIQLLSPTEQQSLKEEIRSIQESVAKHREQGEQIRQQLQMWQQQKKRQEEQQSLQTQQQKLRKKQEALAPRFEKLQRHQKLLPLKPALRQLQSLQKQCQEEQSELEATSLQLKAKTASWNKLKKHKQEQAKTLEDLKSTEADLNQRVQKAREIDQKRSGIQQKEKDLQQQIQEWQASKERSQEKLRHSQQQIRELQISLEKTRNWLGRQSKDIEQLERIIPRLEKQWEDHQESHKVLQDLHTQLEKEELNLKELRRRESESRQALNQLQDDWNALQQQWGEETESDDSRDIILDQISERLETLTRQLSSWSGLPEKWEAQRQARANVQKWEQEWQKLTSEEKALQAALKATAEKRSKARELLEERRALHEQQLRIANYAKDRQQLKEGDPCPVCLSTEHPFRDHPPQDLTDRTQEDLEAAERAWKQADEKYQQMVQNHQRLEGKRSELSNDRQMGILDRERQQLQQLNDQLKKAPSQETIDHTQREYTRMQKKLKQLQKWDRALVELEKKHTTQKAKWRELQREKEYAVKQQQKLTLERKKRLGHSRQLQQTFFETARDFGVTTEVEQPADHLNQLRQLWESWKEKSRQQEQQKSRLVLENKETQRWLEEFQRTREKVQALDQEIQETQQKEEKLYQQRVQLLGDQSPDDALSSFQKQKDALQEAIQQSSDELSGIEKELTEFRTRQDHLQKSVAKKETELRQQSTALQTEAQQRGLPNIEVLDDWLLPEEEAKQLSKTQQALQEEDLRLSHNLDTLNQQLSRITQRTSTYPSQPDLEAQRMGLEQTLQEEQQRIGQLDSQLSADQDQQKESQDLAQKWEQQNKELQRWATLNVLIGQADGKKFRVFAQGLTLQTLIQLANRHLRKLSGRYLLRKGRAESLSLEIEDTYQAGNIRSMNTLSGGESFLVSLALALGLSDLAGRRTLIQSLFIDEGFGTLDEASLDLALTTLENLQSHGKKIGIISHVQTLKERIGTQIHVRKSGSGTSTLDVRS